MKSRARCLVDKSLGAMLAAIEVYNKPNFEYREETFAILAVNAWELLLKARILQLDGNRLPAIVEYEHRRNVDGSKSSKRYIRRNRAGNCVSVGLFKAYDRLVNRYSDSLDPAIRANLDVLSEIRDNSVHFFNKGFDLQRQIHEVGAAALKNYVNATRQWFGLDLSCYNIFLMPLAFVPHFQTAELIGLNNEERQFIAYLDTVRRANQDAPLKDFNVTLTVELRVCRTRDASAASFALSNAPDAIPVTLEEKDIRERYPWDYNILMKRLRTRYADFKANRRYHDIRQDLESDERFCKLRLLDPGNPKSMMKRFYNPNIIREFDRHYTKARQDSQSPNSPTPEHR